jgi:predicted nuclease of predicted toxin-antitoxin system
MKKVFFLLPMLMLAAIQMHAQNDAISRFFSKYADEERFTVVYISPKMFQMVAKIETDDPDWNKFRSVVSKLGGLRVLSADSISDGLALYKEALNKVPINEYSELITVRDGKENVRIWTKDHDNSIDELLLLVGSPSQFVMLSFTGNIDLDQISTLSKSLDVKGINHLDKIKGKGKDKR